MLPLLLVPPVGLLVYWLVWRNSCEVELHPGALCGTETLNRIARQQGLCLAIAQASIFDEICQVISLPSEFEQQHTYPSERPELSEDRDHHLQARGWTNRIWPFRRKQDGWAVFNSCSPKTWASPGNNSLIHYS